MRVIISAYRTGNVSDDHRYIGDSARWPLRDLAAGPADLLAGVAGVLEGFFAGGLRTGRPGPSSLASQEPDGYMR